MSGYKKPQTPEQLERRRAQQREAAARMRERARKRAAGEEVEEITWAEANARGGRRTVAKYGRDHMSSIKQPHAKQQADTLGLETMQEIGRRGGHANSARHDHDHFVTIGKMGGNRLREMLAKAKAMEAAERDAAAGDDAQGDLPNPGKGAET